MHSRIICLSRDPKKDRITTSSDELYELMVAAGSGCDYVTDMATKMDELHDFDEALSPFGNVSGMVIDFDYQKIQDYFYRKFLEFKDATYAFTADDFMNTYKVFLMSSYLEEKYGVYIYTSYAGLTPLDYFLRMITADTNTKNVMTWHMHAVYDYHN